MISRRPHEQSKVQPTYRWLAIMLVALIPLSVNVSSADTPRWWAEFYPNTTLSGSPILTRSDSQINFDWGGGAPAAGVPADRFSVRWTQTEWFDSGTYRFLARADDGFRLWLGDLLVIDAWVDQQGGWITRDLYVNAGTYQVRAEYYENTGGALVTLNWERLSSGPGWLAEYYDNQSLSGSPKLRRTDSAIDFAWGGGSPDSRIPVDRFSVRWTQTLGFGAGTYRFFTSTDDGVRVWVDGQLIIDAWYHQALPNTHSTDRVLTSGLREIKVEYFEDGGEAHAHVWWQQIAGSYSGWKGEYFGNRDLAGGPSLVRDDADINFDWSTGAPTSWMPADNFSVRWTRQATFSPGHYRISVQSDDGVRVWIDGGLVIDKWRTQNNELHYVDGIYLSGSRQLKVEYFEQTGLARIRFWTSPSGSTGGPTPTPAPAGGTVIVDDTSVGFVKGGSATGWHTAAAGYSGRIIWTRNNQVEKANYNWARWYPNLVPGRYEVYVHIPSRYATTTKALYWVKYGGQYASVTVNQAIYFNQWVSLGTYTFAGGNDEYVSLNDITGESYLSKYIGFDAVKWEAR